VVNAIAAISFAFFLEDCGEIPALVQHTNDFDGRICHSIENSIRVNQDCSESRHHVIPGSPQERPLGEPLSCVPYFAQQLVCDVVRSDTSEIAPDLAQIPPRFRWPNTRLGAPGVLIAGLFDDVLDVEFLAHAGVQFADARFDFCTQLGDSVDPLQ
jgi:hypothetical protein